VPESIHYEVLPLADMSDRPTVLGKGTSSSSAARQREPQSRADFLHSCVAQTGDPAAQSVVRNGYWALLIR
jgi:hypothetical protein